MFTYKYDGIIGFLLHAFEKSDASNAPKTYGPKSLVKVTTLLIRKPPTRTHPPPTPDNRC